MRETEVTEQNVEKSVEFQQEKAEAATVENKITEQKFSTKASKCQWWQESGYIVLTIIYHIHLLSIIFIYYVIY